MKPNIQPSLVLLTVVLMGLTGCSVVNQKNVEARLAPGWTPQADYKLAVLPFKSPAASSETLHGMGGGSMVTAANSGEAVADAISGAFLGIQTFQVVERAQIKRILEENNLTMSDLVESPDFRKLKGVLPVQGLVLGAVTEFCNWTGGVNWGATVSFNGRLVDVESGRVLCTFTCSSKKHNGVPTPMAGELAAEAARRIQVELQRGK